MAMDLTSDWLQQIAESYPRSIPPDLPLESVLGRGSKEPPPAYRLGTDQVRAKQAMQALGKLWESWKTAGTGFKSEPPRPAPELRVRARI